MTPTPRSAMLKAETARVHEVAEQQSFMTLLLQGEFTVDDYGRYLTQLAAVYDAMEKRPAAAEDPAVLRMPHLARAERVRSDIRALGIEPGHLVPATIDYVERIVQAWDVTPALVAHHYTRYLGDAAGGQVIARMLQRNYDIPDEALTMYDFSAAGGPVRVRDRFRQALDDLEFCVHQDIVLVAEARAAFTANSRMFADLMPIIHPASP